jgi:geranylgeranyl diphosphate synthase, type I
MDLEKMTSVAAVPALAESLGVETEVRMLRDLIAEWAEQAAPELREMLRWQLSDRSKCFRPLTIFACHRSVNGGRLPASLLRSAVALELFHNVSLIVDDILDRSRLRRGKATLHCRFGNLPALMAAGYLSASVFQLVASDPYSVRLLSELMQRLGVAECRQWRLRRQPLGVADWRAIAAEDTGSMFEVCARLGTRNDRLGRFGLLLGILYHGCDDVGDVRGAGALGGGGDEDLRDGILTLPAAIAIRDPQVAVLFRAGGGHGRAALLKRMRDALDEAETYLDEIAVSAEEEARRGARYPEPLIELVRRTRGLSKC